MREESCGLVSLNGKPEEETGGASESAAESATTFGHQQVTGDLSVIILIK